MALFYKISKMYDEIQLKKQKMGFEQSKNEKSFPPPIS